MSSSGKQGCCPLFTFLSIASVRNESDGPHEVHLLFRELSVGRGSTDTLGGGAMPKINAVEAWDGKDGQVSGSIPVADLCHDLFATNI